MKTINTKVSNYIIEGYENDYVFQTINKTNNFYEVAILDKWTPKFNEARAILDIGSNLGNHTLYWAEKLNYEAIYAFEPYKPTFEKLQNNINNNNLKNVFLVNKGVGNVSGFAHASFTDETNMGATTLEYSSKQDDDAMEIVSIDSFVVENNINNIDFVKIDVESFEPFVLEGMKNVLTQMKPDLWIEVRTETYKKIIDDLKELDYVPVDIEGFNILFLNKCRHTDLKEYDSENILKNMFIYMEKTNTYYKNYLTCKNWLEGKNKQLVNQTEAYSNLKEKYNDTLGEVNNLKENNKKLIEEKVELSNIIEKFVNDFNDEISILKENKALINKLQTQKNYLKHENEEYRRKLSLITDTLVGKTGIKIYKILKKLKAKLK